MLIDWFTVIAQVVNFLILVALLKRFLYGPIIRAMDEREERILSRLKEAEEREQESRDEAERYRRRTEELEQRSREILSAAKEEAEEQRKEMIRKARAEADDLREEWRGAVENQRETFLAELRRLAGRTVYAAAGRALKDLADADLQERMTGVFLRRLKGSDLKEMVPDGDHGLEIRSAFELAHPMQRKIAETIQGHVGRKVEIRFVRREEMTPGIELRAPGRKIAWTLSSYLEGIEEEARKVLEREVSGRGEGMG